MSNPYLPHAVEVATRTEDSPDIFTVGLRFTDEAVKRAYRFAPGQFNMLYLFGGGEVPISIVSDPEAPELIHHTIRAVGRVTEAMARLEVGDKLGLRGAFGTGWPMERARGQDLIMVTGGLGCAPTTSAIEYVMQRRAAYGRVAILHGVKKPEDMIYSDRFEGWARAPDTQVLLAAQEADSRWSGKIGLVTRLLDDVDPGMIKGMALMCGPEVMMRAVAEELLKRGMAIDDVYVSMERNMQCGLGHCGNCQIGRYFACKDGPVFPYAAMRQFMHVKGY
jgi:sulfhydrogenase subunit gamma (sulfur reductase)